MPARGVAGTVAAALVVALTAAACTAGGPPAPAHRSATPSAAPAGLTGTLLLQSNTTAHLLLQTLPAGKPVTLPGVPAAFGSPPAALGPGGRPYMILRAHGRTGVFAVSASGSIRRIGPLAPNAYWGLTISGGVAVAGECYPSQYGEGEPLGFALETLNLAHPVSWHRLRVRSNCSVAVSPDGRTVAYARTTNRGDEIWTFPSDGSGPPRLLLRLSSIAGLQDLGVARPAVVGMSWGGGGLAIFAGQLGGASFTGSPWQVGGLLVRRPSGRVIVAPLGASLPGSLAWQPGGRLLAFTDGVSLPRADQVSYWETRTLDPSTGRIRQVGTSATTNRGGVAWSPDGRTLATERAPLTMAFVGPGGAPLGLLPVSGIPLGWSRR